MLLHPHLGADPAPVRLDCVRARYDADVVTEPGIDAVLALGDAATREALPDKVCVSRLARLAYLVVAGHHDCAANAVPRPVHEEHLRTAVHRLRASQPRLEVAGVCSSTRGDAVSGRGSTPTKPREGACAPC